MNSTCRFSITLLITLLLIVPSLIYSQNSGNDTCSQLKFHSGIEQAGFNLLCSGQKPDFLTMAVAVNPKSGKTELDKIREVVKTETGFLKLKMAAIKKPAAKLKYIFDHVQTTFLKQYDLDADFSDMFKTGKFNCLTATILYATLLDSLSIKNTIKFMPGHVYLIVYANETPYIFETTDAAGGFIELSKAIQDKALQGLRVAQYMFSDTKQNEKSGNFLDSYFIKLNNLEIRGLVGYQYLNLALFKLNKQNFLDSYYNLEKAKTVTPSDELNAFSTEVLGTAIDQAANTSTIRARLVVILYTKMNNPNKKNLIAEDYKSITYECLVGSFPAPDSIHLIHQIMMNGIKDEDVRAVFEEAYLTNYVYYLRTKASPEVRLPTVYKLYLENNDNQLLKNMLIQEINEATEKYVFKSEVEAFDSLVLLYPELANLDVFIYNRCQGIISAAEDAFLAKNAEEGERLLKKFDDEGYFKESRPSYCNPASAYSLAGSYYFKKGNTPKARSVLKKGLTYDPDNYEIKKKLQELK